MQKSLSFDYLSWAGEFWCGWKCKVLWESWITELLNYLGGSMELSKDGPTQCRNYMSFGVAGHADYFMRAG